MSHIERRESVGLEQIQNNVLFLSEGGMIKFIIIP